MRNQLIFLVVVVGLFQLVNCKCSTGLELDCFYEAFFGKDSSEESSSKGDDTGLSSAISNLTTVIQNSILGHGNSPASTSLNKDAVANLNQIPYIVSHLNKLTNSVMGVYNELTKNKHSNEKKPKSSEEKSNENSSKSSNFEPSKEDKSSSEKNEVKKLKDENTNLKKEVSTLNGLVEKLTKRFEDFEKNKTKLTEDKEKSSESSTPSLDISQSTTTSTTTAPQKSTD